MTNKPTPGLLKSVEIFLESTNDFEGLWNGLYLVVWEYLEKNIDEGVAEQITGKFIGDFNNLMELIWFLHNAQRER